MFRNKGSNYILQLYHKFLNALNLGNMHVVNIPGPISNLKKEIIL